MLIYVLFNTHSLHPQWLKFSWIISSSFMECLIPLSLTEIPLSPAIFGNNCSGYRVPNCISSQHIIPRLMIKLKLSTSILETYLRCFSYERQNQWAQWLPLIEWWYNTSYHTDTHMTPFEAIYIWTKSTFNSLIHARCLEGPGG
jgi:hypothetical protein